MHKKNLPVRFTGRLLKNVSLFRLDQSQDFLGGLFGKGVVLHKAADFGRNDSGVFGKSTTDTIKNVVVVVLGASQAELPEQRPVRAVLVLNLENNCAAANPNVRIANPGSNLSTERRQTECQVTQHASGEGIYGIAPGAGLDQLFKEGKVLSTEQCPVTEQIVTSRILDFTIP